MEYLTEDDLNIFYSICKKLIKCENETHIVQMKNVKTNVCVKCLIRLEKL